MTPTTSDARIAPGTWREVGPLAWCLARAGGRRAGTEPIAVFLTIGRHRPLFRGWLHFASRLMPRGTLPRRDTELVILRVAHLAGSAYEFEHHRELGRSAGLSDAEIERVTVGPAAEGWSTREHDLLRATDDLLAHHDLDDAVWASLRSHLDERGCLELLFLVGHYRMLADVLTTLRVRPERARNPA